MLEINKVSYHDKKKSKKWFNVSACHNGIKCNGISETNKEGTKIKFLKYISYTPEEKEIMNSKGVEEGQDVTLTKEEENKLINYIESYLNQS